MDRHGCREKSTGSRSGGVLYPDVGLPTGPSTAGSLDGKGQSAGHSKGGAVSRAVSFAPVHEFTVKRFRVAVLYVALQQVHQDAYDS